MKIPRLKPCPFCGSRDVYVACVSATCVYAAFCNDCAVYGPSVERGDYGDGRDLETRDATRAWNRRKRPVAGAQGAASGDTALMECIKGDD